MTSFTGSVASSSNYLHSDFPITDHASYRMTERRISPEAIDAVLQYGREVATRGGYVYAIGRKEVARYAEHGIELGEFNGVQVVCSLEGVVLTVYRNHNFRQLRTGMGRGRYNRVAHLKARRSRRS